VGRPRALLPPPSLASAWNTTLIKYSCTSLFYSGRLTCFVITSQLVYACRRPYCFTNDFFSVSFYLSYAGTVSKRMDISSHLFDILLGSSFCFVFLAPCTAVIQNSKATRAAPPGMLTMLQRTHLWSWVC